MGFRGETSVQQSDDDNELISPEELPNLGEIEIKSKSNGVYHIEDVNKKLPPETIGSSSPAVNKQQGLKKWRRINRELVKKEFSDLNGRRNGDFTVSMNVNGDYGSGRPVSITRSDSGNSEDQSSRSSTAASAPRMKHDEQQRNGRIEPGKKARGFKIEKENSNSVIDSDSRSSNFVFVQGTNTVASKDSRQSGTFVKHDQDYSDDNANYGDKNISFTKNDQFEDVAEEEHTGKHNDALVESVKGLYFAHEELDKEVQKWRDIGKDSQLIFDDSIYGMLEMKDAKIFQLESALNSEDFKTEFDDCLMKIIQTEVEYVVIKKTTESLTAGSLPEIKHNLQQKSVLLQDLQGPKKQVEKLETQEDVEKLKNRVCKFTARFMIQFIMLLFVILYLKFAPQNVEVVPT